MAVINKIDCTTKNDDIRGLKLGGSNFPSNWLFENHLPMAQRHGIKPSENWEIME